MMIEYIFSMLLGVGATFLFTYTGEDVNDVELVPRIYVEVNGNLKAYSEGDRGPIILENDHRYFILFPGVSDVDGIFPYSCDDIKTSVDGEFHILDLRKREAKCPIRFYNFNQIEINPLTFYIKSKKLNLEAEVKCGNDSKFYEGLSFCHSKGIVQWEFNRKVKYKNTCDIGIKGPTTNISFKPDKEQVCILTFMSKNKRYHKAYVRGL